MEKKILVVDDEKPIADILEFNLKKRAMKSIAHTTAMKRFRWLRISTLI